MIQECCECEVADEPVVVMKFRPVKAGNRVEGKTETIISGGLIGLLLSKAMTGAKG